MVGSNAFCYLIFAGVGGGWRFDNAVDTTFFHVYSSDTIGSGISLNGQTVGVSGSIAAAAGKISAGASTINIGGHFD
jgi:hypothetical protein